MNPWDPFCDAIDQETLHVTYACGACTGTSVHITLMLLYLVSISTLYPYVLMFWSRSNIIAFMINWHNGPPLFGSMKFVRLYPLQNIVQYAKIFWSHLNDVQYSNAPLTITIASLALSRPAESLILASCSPGLSHLFSNWLPLHVSVLGW